MGDGGDLLVQQCEYARKDAPATAAAAAAAKLPRPAPPVAAAAAAFATAPPDAAAATPGDVGPAAALHEVSRRAAERRSLREVNEEERGGRDNVSMT